MDLMTDRVLAASRSGYRAAGFPWGTGEMPSRVRGFAWDATPLGASEHWPQSLKTAAQIVLASRCAMCMGWGKDLTFLYNDAFRPFLGDMHAWALAAPARKVWCDIWPNMERRIAHVFTSGESSRDVFPAGGGEARHVVCCSPLADDSGAVAGVLFVISDETEGPVSDRRPAASDATAADALRTRTMELEAVLATVPAAVWFTREPDGRRVHGNRHSDMLLRLGKDENASLFAPARERPSSYRVFRDGAEAPESSVAIQRAARGEVVRDDEIEIRFNDGDAITLLTNGTPLRDCSGRIVGAVAAGIDISGRKREEARFRKVLESAPSAMVMIDPAGRIVMVNMQAEQLLGYPGKELLGQSLEILVPERFRGSHPRLRGSFFAEPKARPMGAGRDLYARRRDGSEFPVEIGLNPIETEDGIMVLSAIVDMSARKRLEERFRRVVEAAPNAMVMINGEGRIEMVNTQAERVFGYARAELLGQKVEMLVPARLRGNHPGLRQSFSALPRARPMGAGRDLYALRKDGSEFPVEIGLNPIDTEDGPMVLSAIVDISDRKQKEQRIQAALNEKDVLLGEIHHRVKNNLQIIYSLLGLQSARLTDPVVLEMLRDSQNRIRSMALIHQTLYQSKDFAEVDFGHFLDSLVPTLIASYGFDPNNIVFSIQTERVLLPIDAAIPCGLVVNELISNALRHAFQPGQRGGIEVTLRNESGCIVTLCVSDDGVGVPDHIDMTDTATLGLQLVTLLAEQLGGTVVMRRSGPTSFLVRFPIDKTATVAK